MGSRTWIKVYVDKWLEGTISEESISVRGVWISLLALAGNGKYGDSGEIKALDGVGFTDQQLTLMLKVNPKMWGIARKRLLSTDRIVVNNGNVITIINWNKYQSEYERTSKYRINATTSDTPNDTPRDKRVESIEERVEKESSSSSSSPLEEDSQVNKLSEDMAEIATLYEAEIGKITGVVGQELNDAVQNYAVDWIRKAIKEAVRQNKRKWSYVKGILENWKEPGRQGTSKGRDSRSFKECPECHYLVEISKVTERIEICSMCAKKGKEVRLVVQR